jgi:hypothetical protein
MNEKSDHRPAFVFYGLSCSSIHCAIARSSDVQEPLVVDLAVNVGMSKSGAEAVTGAGIAQLCILRAGNRFTDAENPPVAFSHRDLIF